MIVEALRGPHSALGRWLTPDAAIAPTSDDPWGAAVARTTDRVQVVKVGGL